MQFTRIAVQAENDWCSEARVRVAALIAADHGAELVGIVSDESALEVLAGVPVSRAIEAAATIELQQHRADAAERFRRAARAHLDKSSLFELQGDLVTGLLQASLCADLLVICQDPGPRDEGEAITTQIVLGAACPTLIVPRDYGTTFTAQRVLVGWKATVPTARALRGALPLLRHAETVLLAHVQDQSSAVPSIHEAAHWLQRQGVEVGLIELPPDPDDPGHALLDEADKFGADLIVGGAFARTPFRERLLGGATATLLAESALPLLLTH